MASIGQTIAQQIGNRALVMMGAKQLVAVEGGLQFAIGKNARKVTKIRIELDPSDTYTIRFYTGKAEGAKFDARTGQIKTTGGYTEIATVEGVYVDSMHRTIEAHTELYLSL